MTRGAMQSAAKPYFVDYYLINSLTGWFGETNNLLGLFLGLTMAAGVGGAIAANWLIRSFCKVRIMKYALAGTVVMNLSLFLVPREWMFQALLLTMCSNFFHMMFVPLLFSTIPDTVDYGKRTLGAGAMAMFCAGHLFVLKAGNAVGGFLTGFLLSWFGYEANVEQTERALTGIVIAFAGSSVVAALLVIFCLQFYRLTRGWQDRVPEAQPAGPAVEPLVESDPEPGGARP
jgi:GPH family glycoside/pentoside/hexuronide:cation symporter